jgi:hypothetical protein
MALSPSNPRSGGFGLNYNRGFNSGRVFSGGGADPDLQRTAFQGYQQRLGGQQAHQQGMERDRFQQQFQSGQLDKQLAQQDRQLANQYKIASEGYGNQMRIAQTQAEAAKYPHILKQQRWNQIWPWAQGQIKGMGNFTAGYQGPGAAPAPEITVSPVWSDQQINERVNLTRSQNDAATAAKSGKIANEMAGRGFGSRSPLAAYMQTALQGMNLQGNTQAENDLRFGAAEANAKQILAAQQARAQQYAEQEAQKTERGKVQVGALNQLMGNIFAAV